MTDGGAGRLFAAPVATARTVPTWVWLAALVVASTVVRYLLGRRTVAPWIVVDEIIYSELAKSFAESGSFAIRGNPVGASLGVVYPLLISPAYVLDSLPSAYAAVKAINAFVMSLAAVPTYFLARRVLPAPQSLLAAVLAVSIPPMLYTGMVMTESVFYPVWLCACLALVLLLERPTIVRAGVLLALVALGFLTRVQAVVLIPALITAPLLLVALRGRRAELRPFRSLYLALVGGMAAVLVFQLARGRSLGGIFGVYRTVVEEDYELRGALRWIGYHVAELDLFLGIAPFAALVVLLLVAKRLPSADQAFLAAALSLTVWLVVQVGMFASLPGVSRIEERNMFYVAPLFLIALLLWIERGLPRPRAAGLVAAAAAALPALLPFRDLIGVQAVADTFGLLPWWRVHEWGVPLDRLGLTAVLAAVVVAATFLYVPRRYAVALPVFVLIFFAVSTQPVEARIRTASVGALFQGITVPERDWVDRAVGRDAEVAAIWSGRVDRFVVHQNEFFSRSVGDVFHLREPIAGNLIETRLTPDRETGIMRDPAGRTVSPRYVLTDESVSVVGRPVASDRRKGVALYALNGPLRAATKIDGLYDDGWSGKRLVYTRYQCSGGSVLVELQSDPKLFERPQTVVVRVRGEVTTGRVVDPGATKYVTVPLVPQRGRCEAEFAVSPTAVPASVQAGSVDERLLGIRFNRFVYKP